MTKTANNRTVVYVRISEDRPGIETSTGTQEKEAREFAAQQGWEVIEPIQKDVGISAYKGVRRPALNEALRMIETKQADILLVWKLDRLVRSITAFHGIMDRIQNAGGRFASVTDAHLNSNRGTAGQMMSGLVAGFAQMESEIKSDRLKSWQRERIARGQHNGGTRAYGYATVSGKLAIVNTEADVLRSATQSILKGATLRGTLRELSPMSARSSAANPVPMTHRGLRSALTNPTVAGLRRDGKGGYVRGNWEPIINRSDWDSLNTLFGNPDRRTGDTNQLTHLLSGILTCDRCAKGLGIRKWKANPTNRNPYVQESHRYTCQCGNSISANSAEEVTMERLWQIVTPDQWADWKSAGTGWDQSVIDGIRSRRERVMMDNVLGKIGDEACEEMTSELDRQEAIATGEQPLDLPDTDDPRRDWKSLNIIDQRKVITQAFQSITLNQSNGTRDPRKRLGMS